MVGASEAHRGEPLTMSIRQWLSGLNLGTWEVTGISDMVRSVGELDISASRAFLCVNIL